MREALFFEKKGNNVKCSLCARNCIIPDGKSGFCRVRKNINGKLYSLVYGRVCAASIDPIEKKPLYMFDPGSKALSISTVGCNFKCDFCCNFELSCASNMAGDETSPQAVVEMAKRSNVQGIAYTYNEPTVFFEFALDIAKIAKKHGLYNIFVTNGYTSTKAIDMIAPYLDAATVDFKGSANPEFYKKFCSVPNVQPIFDALLAYKKNSVHVEITNLIVPNVDEDKKDFKKLCEWIVKNMGPKTPFHILRFYPSYKMSDRKETDVKILEECYKMAKEIGLEYVYLGNVSGHKYENTYCHNCGKMVIERTISGVIKFLLKDNSCPFCKEKLPVNGLKWSKLTQEK
ncbi:MAG: AmmeMemoRadiSam system radical SAM enzyme [Candidatus Aenigmarchaeota archaeon]|nr:AmmeMemoRadiSam system radical SAM enzyme [Candidatus Aenigmarchaeota archaeon]